MKFTFWFDTHIGAPNALPVVFNPDDKNEYLGGDIIDLANCTTKATGSFREYYMKLKNKYGPRYIDGNHERTSKTNDFIILQGTYHKAILVHGDFESWGKDKAVAYRSKPHGAGAFKRNIIVKAIEIFEANWKRNISTEFYSACVLKAKAMGCDYVICGHMHPPENIVKTIEGVTVIVCKRGKTELAF